MDDLIKIPAPVPPFKNMTFLAWAQERWRMKREREKIPDGSPPWSSDPIMANHRFCNVRREDDAVTRWIKRHVRDRYDGHPDVVRIIALARFINQPSTLHKIFQDPECLSSERLNLNRVVHVVNGLMEKGWGPVWRSAYMVRSETNKETAHYGKGKIAYVAHLLSCLEPNVTDAGDYWPGTRESFTRALADQRGFGMFMAGQVAADLSYMSFLKDASDHRTWAPQGPGAIRGMNLALGLPWEHQDNTISEQTYLDVGRLQMKLIEEAIPELLGQLDLHDVASNVNCETFKYMRARFYGQSAGRRYLP